VGVNTNIMKIRKLFRSISVFFLTVFGLLTLFLSTSVIFDLFGIREMEGNYVLFIVWANFIASILYLFAAVGFLQVKKWTTLLLGISLIVLIIAFVLLKMYIADGGVYEEKTVNAMIFRTGLTMVLTLIAYLTIQKDN